jgi:hypothetical protein
MLSIKNRKMKMFKLNSIFSVVFCIFMLINSSNLFVSGKNIDQLSRSRHTKDENSCERVKQYFDTINITINPTYDKTGKFTSQLAIFKLELQFGIVN